MQALPIILSRALALVVSTLCSGALLARAEVRLPALFSDHMVLQQNRPIPVWGWADPAEKITVEFRGQTVQTTAHADGKWKVDLEPEDAGGPHPFGVRGKNAIDLKDVLVGEVWICSGQSNMEWPLSRSAHSQAAITNSANPKLRLFTVPKNKALQPVDDVKSAWQECAPATVPGFSAVAYLFGRDLQKALGVPVGLIHTSWGGSPAEVWMRAEVLAQNPAYKREILDPFDAQNKQFQNAVAEFEKAEAAAKAAQQPFDRKKPQPPFWRPTELYNGMIAPLIPFAIRGAIWYQGESNAGRAQQYRTLFPDMISNWRSDWRQGDFTFLAVQLAPWDKNRKRTIEEIAATPGPSDWAELREAQVHATQTLPNVGMAVITDAGDKDDIHPTQKEPVGARLALAARAIAYGEKIVASGPMYQSLDIQGNKAIVSFDHIGGGLEARGGALTGFALAGADGKYVWAAAEIRGETVVVTSPEVPAPVAVRYGWADYPVVNLLNKEGLPASPFRTNPLDK